MVRVRPVKEPALLRRVTQGNGPGTEEDGDYRSPDSSLVRLQAFKDHAVLRWNAFAALRRTGLAFAFKQLGGVSEVEHREVEAAAGIPFLGHAHLFGDLFTGGQ